MLLLLLACDASGERREDRRFTAGRMVDAHRVAFTFRDEAHRPGRVDVALLRGRPARPLRDVNGIGTYELATGAVRVLWRKDYVRTGWLGARCGIVQQRGARLLVTCGGQRADYRTSWEVVVIDLSSGAAEVVPLDDELAVHGYEKFFGRPILLDEAGGIAILGSLSVERSLVDDVKELLVRRPSGEIVAVGRVAEYLAYREGKLHFLAPDQRQLVFELRTGRTAPARPEDEALRWERPPRAAGEVSVVVDSNGTSRLRVERTVAGVTQQETLPLAVRDVADRRPR